MLGWILAHGDLDGMASAALVISHHLRLNKEFKYRIYFSQPFSLHHALARMGSVRSGLVYILDIALDEEHWDINSRVLRALAEENDVTWVDHHPATIARKRDIENLGIKTIVSQAPSATTLLQPLIPHTLDPDFSKTLISLAELSDASTPQSKENSLVNAVEVLTGAIAYDPQDDDFKKRIIETWVKRRVLVPEEAVIRFQESEEKFQKLLREANNRVIYESPLLRIVDLREVRVYGFSGKIASLQANTDGKIVLLVFRIGQDATVITGRAPKNSNISLVELFSKISREWGASGGGHYHAASLRVPAAIADKVIRTVIDEIEKTVPELNLHSAN
ncbi:MAG: hypothetical protein ABWK01_04305 [Infirmifilum sp.]